jgi:hypothetical protein
MFTKRGLLQGSLAVAAAVLFVLGIQADQPTRTSTSDGGKKSGFSREDLAAKERILAEKYREFEQALLILKQRLEKSDRKEDRDRAVVLGKALERSGDINITTKFTQLIQFLSTQKLSKVTDVNLAARQAGELARDLKAILDILRNNTNVTAKREERLQLEQLLKELERVIRDQKIVNGRIEDGRGNPKEVARDQRDVRSSTRSLEKKLGDLNKEEKGKTGEGGEAKESKGDAKTGKGKGAKGEGKNSGKGSDAKKGEGKNAGKGGDSKKGEAKANDGQKKGGEGSKEGQKGEAKAGGKGGDKQQGGAKGGQKSGEGSKQGGAKGSKGSEGSKQGGAKGGEKSGDKQGQAKGAEQNKVRQKPDDQQGSAKKGGDQKGKQGDKQGGAKSSQGGDKQSSQSKSGQSSQGQGQSKSSQSKGGKGSPKSGGGKQGDQQAGNQKDDNQKQNTKEGDDTTLDARKRIRDAEDNQGKAAQNVEKNNKRPALEEGEKAVDNLEKAKKKLEDLLRQLREEELERLLTELKARCEKMLAMQIQVYNGTKAVARAIDGNADKKATRANTQDSLNLSDDEKKIVEEANKAIGMLEAEGSAVAFHEVFTQVREDMKHVQRRLGAVDVGKVTQAVEQDIIDTLNEMIKALEKAKQDLQNQKPKQGQPGPPPPNQDQKLLDQIAELKMIRAMQLRINSRTTLYGRQYEGEQAGEVGVQRELRNLADRQDRLFKVTGKIASGDNR